jgi:hypothetical protein
MTITFGSLTFATGEDENLKMLLPGPAPEHLTTVYEQAPCFLAISSITDDACLGLDPYAGLHSGHSGHSDRDVYPPAIGWGIELILINSVC